MYLRNVNSYRQLVMRPSKRIQQNDVNRRFDHFETESHLGWYLLSNKQCSRLYRLPKSIKPCWSSDNRLSTMTEALLTSLQTHSDSFESQLAGSATGTVGSIRSDNPVNNLTIQSWEEHLIKHVKAYSSVEHVSSQQKLSTESVVPYDLSGLRIPSTQNAVVSPVVGPRLGLKCRTIPVRNPQLGEVVVRILYTGLCRSVGTLCGLPRAFILGLPISSADQLHRMRHSQRALTLGFPPRIISPDTKELDI
jgi:hypothetical protein